MQFFYLIAAFLAFAVAPSAAERKRCDQLPTNISHDARLTVQPQGKGWMLYKATKVERRCLNMSYDGNRNNNTLQASFTFWDCKDKFHYPTKVDVNPKMNSWIITDDSGASLTYYKLVLNDDEHWWCVYACDAKKEKIEDAFCGVIDEEGKKALDDFLAKNFPDKDLPLKDGQTLGVVYDSNCLAKSS